MGSTRAYEFRSVIHETLGPVSRIWLNRPDLANAQDLTLLDELDQALTIAEEDDDIRVIIIAAKGKHFSAGHDVKTLDPGLRDTVEKRWAQEERYYFDYCMRFLDMHKPIIAQVQGGAVAAGFMIANVCDLIVASDDAFFADPVLNAFGAPGVEVLIHPWVLGHRRAKELLFTGERLSAQDAYAAGMVNRVVPRDQLEEQTLVLARKIANVPPYGMRLTKRAFNHALEGQGFRNALQSAFDLHQLSHASAEQSRMTTDLSAEEQIVRMKGLSRKADGRPIKK